MHGVWQFFSDACDKREAQDAGVHAWRSGLTIGCIGRYGTLIRKPELRSEVQVAGKDDNFDRLRFALQNSHFLGLEVHDPTESLL